MIVYSHNEAYPCSKAEKGADYIRLYDENDNPIVSFSGIRDFSGFRIEGGTWSLPEATQADRTEAQCLYTALLTDTLLGGEQ